MSRVMKDSGIEWIGEIPEEWKTERVKYILNERKEKNNPIKTENILSLTNEKGVIPYSEKGNHGNKAKDDLTGYKLAYPNDIVINSMNVVIGSVGLSKYYGCVSPVYYVLYSTNINIKYYNYIFQTKVFQNNLKGLGNGILDIRMRIPMEKLNMLFMPLPPLREQQKIADFLDEKVAEIDSAIEKTKVTIEDYKKYKQSIITEAVTIGINKETKYFNSDVIGLGKVREDAQILKFKYVGVVKANLVNVKDYLEYPQIAPDKIEKSSGKLLFYNKVKEAGVISDNHLFYKGMIIYSKIRPLLNKAIIAEFDGLCSADMYPIESYINTKYLLYYILSNAFLGQISVSDNRVKMPKLNKEELYEIKVVVPSENEQEKIVEYLDKKCSEIDVLIAKKEELIKELESYKKSLIYECVTGKREV